jgi:hypothetical protein
MVLASASRLLLGSHLRPMPRLPDLLRLLTRDELLAAADRLGVALPERRAKDPIVEALAAAPAATPEAVFADLKRDRLKALCRALDLDDSGKEKAEIIARLAGGPTTSEARGQAKLDFAGTTDPPAPPVAAGRPRPSRTPSRRSLPRPCPAPPLPTPRDADALRRPPPLRPPRSPPRSSPARCTRRSRPASSRASSWRATCGPRPTSCAGPSTARTTRASSLACCS